MMTQRDDDKYDLTRMIAASLYQGIFINILLPAGLLLAAYFIDQSGGMDNSVGGFANSLFYILAAISVAEGGIAVLWRTKALNQPMVRRRETFEQDVREQLSVRLRPVFLLIASIALNGFAYYLVAGRFEEGLALVMLSFIAFQVVRPRYGMLRKVIETQEELVAQGQVMGR